MADKKKISAREFRENHSLELDASDSRQRSRRARNLDNLYKAGLLLEEAGISDVARGSAVKAALSYAELTGGKAVTPTEMEVKVTNQSLADRFEQILSKAAREADAVRSRPIEESGTGRVN